MAIRVHIDTHKHEIFDLLRASHTYVVTHHSNWASFFCLLGYYHRKFYPSSNLFYSFLSSLLRTLVSRAAIEVIAESQLTCAATTVSLTVKSLNFLCLGSELVHLQVSCRSSLRERWLSLVCTLALPPLFDSVPLRCHHCESYLPPFNSFPPFPPLHTSSSFIAHSLQASCRSSLRERWLSLLCTIALPPMWVLPLFV